MEAANIEQLQKPAAERNAPCEEVTAFVAIARVKEISGLSKSTILRRIKAGTFPAPVISEGNCVRFDLAEVMAWRAAQFKARDERMAAQQPEARA